MSGLNDFLDQYRNAMSGSAGNAAPPTSGVDTDTIMRNVDARLNQESNDAAKGYQQSIKDAKARQIQSIKDQGYEVTHDANGNATPRQAQLADGTSENVRRKFNTDIYQGEQSGKYYQPNYQTGQLDPANPKQTTDPKTGVMYNDYGHGFKTVSGMDPSVQQKSDDHKMLTQADLGLLQQLQTVKGQGDPAPGSTRAYNAAKFQIDRDTKFGEPPSDDPNSDYQKHLQALTAAKADVDKSVAWRKQQSDIITNRQMILDHKKMVDQGTFTPDMRAQYQATQPPASAATQAPVAPQSQQPSGAAPSDEFNNEEQTQNNSPPSSAAAVTSAAPTTAAPSNAAAAQSNAPQTVEDSPQWQKEQADLDSTYANKDGPSYQEAVADRKAVVAKQTGLPIGGDQPAQVDTAASSSGADFDSAPAATPDMPAPAAPSALSIPPTATAPAPTPNVPAPQGSNPGSTGQQASQNAKAAGAAITSPTDVPTSTALPTVKPTAPAAPVAAPTAPAEAPAIPAPLPTPVPTPVGGGAQAAPAAPPPLVVAHPEAVDDMDLDEGKNLIQQSSASLAARNAEIAQRQQTVMAPFQALEAQKATLDATNQAAIVNGDPVVQMRMKDGTPAPPISQALKDQYQQYYLDHNALTAKMQPQLDQVNSDLGALKGDSQTHDEAVAMLNGKIAAQNKDQEDQQQASLNNLRTNPATAPFADQLDSLHTETQQGVDQIQAQNPEGAGRDAAMAAFQKQQGAKYDAVSKNLQAATDPVKKIQSEQSLMDSVNAMPDTLNPARYEENLQRISDSWGVPVSKIADVMQNVTTRPYSIGDDGHIQFQQYGTEGTPTPQELVAGIQGAINDKIIDPVKSQDLLAQAQKAQSDYDAIVKSAGSDQIAKAIVHGTAPGLLAATTGAGGARIGAVAGTALAGGPEDPLAAITAPAGAVIGSLITMGLTYKAASAAQEALGKYSTTIKSLNDSAVLHPTADAAGNLLGMAMAPEGLLSPSTWGKGTAETFMPAAVKSGQNIFKLGQMGSEGVAEATKLMAKGGLSGAAFEAAIRPAFDYAQNKVLDVISPTQPGEAPRTVESPTFSSILTNAALGVAVAGHSVEFKDWTPQQVASIMVRGKVRSDAGVAFGADMAPDTFEKNGVPLTSENAPEMTRPMTPEEIQVYAALKDKAQELQKSGAFDNATLGVTGARQAKVGGTTLLTGGLKTEPLDESAPAPPAGPGLGSPVGPNIEGEASDAELSSSDADPEDISRAQTLRDIATGTKVADMTEGELNAVGLTRPQGSDNIKAFKDSEPAVHVDGSGNAVILQPAIDELQRQFPATAATVKMSEREARAHFSAPEETPEAAAVSKPAEVPSTATAPNEEKADALEKAAAHLEATGKSHNIAPLREEAQALREQPATTAPAAAAPVTPVAAPEKTVPTARAGDAVRSWMQEHLEGRSPQEQTEILQHPNTKKVKLIADALDKYGHLFNQVRVTAVPHGIGLDPGTGDLLIDPVPLINSLHGNSVADISKRISDVLFEEKEHRLSVLLEKTNPQFADDLQKLWESVSPETKEQQKLAYWKKEGRNFASDWHAKHEWWADVRAAAERGEIPHGFGDPGLTKKLMDTIKSYLKALKDWLAKAPVELKERFQRSIKALKELEEKLNRGEKPLSTSLKAEFSPADENGWKQEVVKTTKDGYKISVDDKDNATTASAWKDGKKVGQLTTLSAHKNAQHAPEGWLGVHIAHVATEHRGKGLGTEMYRALASHLGEEYEGLYAQPKEGSRYNDKEIPAIYKKLSGHFDENGNGYLPKIDERSTSNQQPTATESAGQPAGEVGTPATGKEENETGRQLQASLEPKEELTTAPNSEREAVAQHTFETAKGEILDDIASGKIPSTIKSFSELNDHVDANEYVNDADRKDRRIGPLGKSLAWKPQDYTNFTNDVIGRLNKWLQSRPVNDKNEPLGTAPGAVASPDFYSHLQRAIEAKMPVTASVEQIKGIINSGGVKAEEVKWSGVEPWLESQGGKVSKSELLNYLKDDGKVRLEEHVLSPSSKWRVRDSQVSKNFDSEQEAQEERERWIEDQMRSEGDMPGATRKEAENEIRLDEIENDDKKPQYSQYQLPGGEGYHEMVLAMPQKPDNAPVPTRKEYTLFDPHGNAIAQGNAESAQRWKDEGRLEKGQTIREQDVPDQNAIYRKNKSEGVYRSSHFSEIPNYIAHMRVNTRSDADGRKGLFLEELQSDRHQQGRDKGYATPEAKKAAENEVYSANNAFESLMELASTTPKNTPMDAKLPAKLEAAKKRVNEAREALNKVSGTILEAPFRSTWHVQLFKRALRDAVAAGHDWIGWTTGDTQAERYDLSKQVNAVHALRTKEGNYHLTAETPGSEQTLGVDVPPDKISDYVGKELTAKITAQAKGPQVYRGLDLKVGGEGMKGFYDNILPKEIQKYVKQWGAGVERGGVPDTEARTEKHIQSDAATLREDSPGEPDYLKYQWTDRNGNFVGPRFGKRGGPDGAEQWKRDLPETHPSAPQTPVWRVRITPEMRSGVEKGQPLFAAPSSNQPEPSHEDAVAFANLFGLKPPTKAQFQKHRQQQQADLNGKAETPPGETSPSYLDGPVSVQNAWTNAYREANGFDPKETGHIKNKDAWKGAQKRVAKAAKRGVDIGEDLIQDIIKNERAPEDVQEQAILQYELKKRSQEFDAATLALEGSREMAPDPVAVQRYVRAKDRANDALRASDLAGEHGARALQFRRMGVGDDFSLVRMLKSREIANGKPLDETQEKEVRQQWKEIVRAQEDVDRISALEKQNTELEKMLHQMKHNPISPISAAKVSLKKQGLDALARLKSRLNLSTAPSAPEQDAAYLDAVNRGDTETAQRMVDEAAKRAGYIRKVYHGTEDGGFVEFDPERTSKKTGFIYVSTGKGTAASYSGSSKTLPAGEEGRGIHNLYVKQPERIYDFEEAGWDGNKPDGTQNEWYDFGGIDGIAQEAKREGIKSFEVQNVLDEGPNGNGAWYDSTIGVADPSLIKSADPVTRDANGRVIPLSERFNPESNSILHTAPDDENLRDLSIFGAHVIENGASDLASFQKAIEAELPGVLSSYDPAKIYESAKQIMAEIAEAKSPQGVVNKIKSKRETSDALTQNDIRKLALSLIQHEEISEVGPLTTRLHQEVSKIFPDLTEDDIAKKWTGVEGEPVYPNQEPAHKTLRDLRRQKIALQRRKMVEGDPVAHLPGKIGPQMDAPTDLARKHERELADAIKDSGLKPADPATQMKTAQDRLTTALTHRRDDLLEQVAQKKREVRSTKGTDETPEIKKLREEIASLNTRLDQLDPRKTGMTQAQRIKAAENGAVKSLQNIDKEIADLKKLVDAKSTAGVPVKGKPAELHSPTLDTLHNTLEGKRDLRDELRNTLDDLRDAATTPDDPVKAMLDKLKVRQNKMTVPVPPRVKSHLERLAESYIKEPASTDFVAEAQKFGMSQTDAEQAKVILDAEHERRGRMADRAYERRLDRSIARQEEREAAFNKDDPLVAKSKKAIALSDQNKQKLKVLEDKKLAARKAEAAYEMRNRAWWDKSGALVAKLVRTNMLTNLAVFAKLAENAISTIGLTPLADAGPGTIVNTLLPGLADASPRFHGGTPIGPIRPGINLEGEKAAWSLRPSTEAQARGIVDAFKKLFQEHMHALNEGKPSPYADPKKLDPSLTDLFKQIRDGSNSAWERLKAFGHIPITLVPHSHAFVKTTPWLQEYWRTFENHIQWMMKNKVDSTTPAALQAAHIRGVEYANRAILQQDNFWNTARTFALRGMKTFEGSPASETVGKVGAHIANAAEPITKVGTNLINNVIMGFIGVPVAVGELSPYFVKAAIDQWKTRASPADVLNIHKFMTAAQANLRVLGETEEGQSKADSIQRHARIGMLGWAIISALGALGYEALRKLSGGFYERGKKNAPDEPKPDKFRLPDGTDIGKAPGHTMPGMMTQAVESWMKYVNEAADVSKKAIAKKQQEIEELTFKSKNATSKTDADKYSEELKDAEKELEQLKKEGDPAQLNMGGAMALGLGHVGLQLFGEIPHVKSTKELLEMTSEEPSADQKIKRAVTGAASIPIVSSWERTHDVDANGDQVSRRMKSWADYWKGNVDHASLPRKDGNFDELGFPRDQKRDPVKVEKAITNYNKANPLTPYELPPISPKTLDKLPLGTEDVFRARAGELIQKFSDVGTRSGHIPPISDREASNPTGTTIAKLDDIVEAAHKEAKTFVANPANVSQYQQKMAELKAKITPSK